MPRGNTRRLLIIAVLIGLAVATLAFSTIDVGVSDLRFHRGASGPLGLRLGLDLQGGMHLVYQAVRPPNNIRLAFEDAEETTAERIFEVLTPVLEGMERDAPTVEQRALNTFTVTVECRKSVAEGETAGLTSTDQVALRDALTEQIGVTSVFAMVGCEKPKSEDMEGVASIIERRVNEFGVTEPTVQILGDERLLVQLPGVGDAHVRVGFEDPVGLTAVRRALAPLGRPSADIEQEDPSTFTIRIPSLRPAVRDTEGGVVEPPESELIRGALDMVDPIRSFQVSGGVEEAKRLIGQTAVLEFKHRACLDQLCLNYQDNDLDLTGDDLARAFPDRQVTTSDPIVSIEFNSRGSKIFGDLTSRISAPNEVGAFDRIAIFLDDEELLAPVARQAILGGRAFIEGADFTAESVRTMAIQLESGRLPIPIEIIQERDVDATLGADSIRKSLIGGGIGLGLVLLFMAAYYRIPGIMAAGALLTYTLLALATFKLVPVTLTLAGVAGFILSIGMAVDANILIFERMKEELRSGRTLLGAIETGFERAWPSIRDSNVSTFITCGILWWFGTRLGASLVVGFAFTLLIGVSVSMFTAIFVSRSFLRLSAQTPLRRLQGLFSPVPGQITRTTPATRRR